MNDKLKFLFIDQNAAFNFFAENVIELDCLPIKARFELNPDRSLHHLRSCEARDFPRVIIAEINMPLYNGFEFADRFSAEFAAMHPDCLLFLTSNMEKRKYIQQIEAHPAIAGFLRKPFSKKSFEKVIQPQLSTVAVGS
ncbi:MAG: response regulator [Bacteroidota bacterium]